MVRKYISYIKEDKYGVIYLDGFSTNERSDYVLRRKVLDKDKKITF